MRLRLSSCWRTYSRFPGGRPQRLTGRDIPPRQLVTWRRSCCQRIPPTEFACKVAGWWGHTAENVLLKARAECGIEEAGLPRLQTAVKLVMAFNLLETIQRLLPTFSAPAICRRWWRTLFSSLRDSKKANSMTVLMTFYVLVKILCFILIIKLSLCARGSRTIYKFNIFFF